jgi:hypothetical protein
MAQKKYCLYNPETIEGDQRFAVQVGRDYVAMVLGTSTKIAGLECYDAEDNDLEELLGYIKEQSLLLDRNYSETRVYYNMPESVLVPVGQFNTSLASEFLDIAFGNSPASQINVENVNIQPGIIHVYRSNEQWQRLLTQSFRAVTKRHLFSKLIETAPAGSLKLQVYKNEIIIIAMNHQGPQLVRSFEWETDEDILYHLLNTCKQTGIDAINSTIDVCGFIDADSKAMQLLKQYFGKVKLDTPQQGIMPSEELSKHPLHYFTPFINLLS